MCTLQTAYQSAARLVTIFMCVILLAISPPCHFRTCKPTFFSIQAAIYPPHSILDVPPQPAAQAFQDDEDIYESLPQVSSAYLSHDRSV